MTITSGYFSRLWKVLTLFLVLKICAAEQPKADDTRTWVKRLRQDLLTNYDKYVRPKDYNVTIKIRLHLEIVHVTLDDDTGLFTLYGRLLAEWKDPKLVWDKSKYNGVDLLPLVDHEIWLPDLVVYNSALKDSAQYYGNAQCYVRSNGDVTWIPYARYQIFCEMDTRLWPFDSHKCKLVLGSWTFSEWSIDLEFKEENGSVLNLLVKNNEWDISNISVARTSKYYVCCEAPYVSVTYDITVARRAAAYKAVIYTPTICVVLMTLACFWLPPQSGEKIVLNGLNLVLVVMLIRYFADKLPSLALSTPLIVSFYCSTLVLVSFSMIISVTVLGISKSRHTRQVPVKIRSLLKGCLGKFLGVANLKTRVEESELKEQQNTTTVTETSSLTQEFYQSDWLSLASAVDRVAFIVYCIGFSLIIISLYV